MQLEGMKRWIRLKASARKFCSGKQAAREVAPLLAVIAAFLKGYQTFFHPVVLPEEMGPDCWEVPHTQLGQISWIRSSSPAHPWHCACEGYGKSEGSLCFHHALQGDNPSRTTNACHLVIPRISLFHPRTTASKKKLFRELLCFIHFLHNLSCQSTSANLGQCIICPCSESSADV